MTRRILFVASIGATLNGFLRQLSTAAQAEGFETIACAEGATALEGFTRTYDLPAFRRRGARAVLGAARALERVVREEQPAVTSLHTPFALGIGRLVSARNRVPSIAVVHGTYLGTSTWRAPVFAVAEGAVARLSKRTVTVNAEDARFYRRVAGRSRVAVAPAGGGGVSAERFATRASADARGPEDPPAIVFLGRFTPDKGLDQLVDAWRVVRRRHPDVVLRLVGRSLPGDPPWTPPDVPGVDVVGWTDDPIAEMHRARVVAMPSAREGFAMAVAEGLIAGVPVVAVSSRGTRQIKAAAGDRLVLVEPDTDALADALERALDGPRLGFQADLAETWSSERVTRFHLDLITEVAR